MNYLYACTSAFYCALAVVAVWLVLVTYDLARMRAAALFMAD
jgi:hypothetical protein